MYALSPFISTLAVSVPVITSKGLDDALIGLRPVWDCGAGEIAGHLRSRSNAHEISASYWGCAHHLGWQ